MIYPKASSKLKIKPWIQKQINPVLYMAREGPVVFFSALAGALVAIPTMIYLYNNIRAEPKGMAHQKVYYSVIRPEDYPKEMHKYCR